MFIEVYTTMNFCFWGYVKPGWFDSVVFIKNFLLHFEECKFKFYHRDELIKQFLV